MIEFSHPNANKDILVKDWVCGPLGVNCYLVASVSNRDAILIDPGYFEEEILVFIEKEAFNLRIIIATHAHLDHVLAIPEIKKRLNVEVACHEMDIKYLAKPDPFLVNFIGHSYEPFLPDRILKDGDEIVIGSEVMTVIHTPGHTPGSICLLMFPYLFSGDTLFQAGIGRTDLIGGSYDALIDSLNTRLMPLPNELILLPGHGYSSTLGEEKKGFFSY